MGGGGSKWEGGDACQVSPLPKGGSGKVLALLKVLR